MARIFNRLNFTNHELVGIVGALHAVSATYVNGRLVIGVGCQSHPMDYWREHGRSIVARNFAAPQNPLTNDELMALLVEDAEEAHDKLDALLTKKKTMNKAQLARLATAWRGLSAVLDFIEATMVDEKKAPVNCKKKAVKGKAKPKHDEDDED